MSKELTPIVLTDEQTLEISALPGEFDYDKDSQLKGQKYRRFKYNNTVFTVNTAHEFCKMYDDENIGLVKIAPVADKQDPSIIRFQLDSAKSQSSVLKVDQFKAKRKVWQSYDPAKVDNELLSALQS
jgi:hypothetical protein